jgi:hypothetical protein
MDRAEPMDVIATEDGYVAAGNLTPGIAEGGCGIRCAAGVGVWWSRDALDWELVFEDRDQSVSFGSLTAGTTTKGMVYVVVGGDGAGGFLLISTDGRQWVRRSQPEFAGQRLSGLVQRDSGEFVLAALGPAIRPASTVWRSSDLDSWSAVAGPAPPGLSHIAAAAFELIGYDPWLEAGEGIWASTDGEAWTRQEALPRPSAVTNWTFVGDGGFMAVGQYPGASPAIAPLWITSFSTG